LLKVLYHHARFGGAQISPATRATKNVEFFVCMCMCITRLNDRDCAHDFAMNAFEYRNDFDAVGFGKVCSCALTFIFLHMPPDGMLVWLSVCG